MASTSASKGNIYGVAAGGLTTAVSAPVTLSAAELHEGCTEMKAWADSTGISDAESLLSLAQLTSEGENQSWVDATPSDQAAAIAVINAVVDGDC